MEKKEYKQTSRNSEQKISPDIDLECAVCLQTCVHPVRLPCTHIFCFLCVKGVANQSKRCAMCRQEIPADFLDNPNLLKKVEEKEADPEGYQWFYEGRNGWWQYDERTSKDLENAYSGGERMFEVLVAGFLYTVDFDRMIQQRRNDPSRRRRIKRDLASIPKKGVAGLKTTNQLSQEEEQQILTTPSESACDSSSESVPPADVDETQDNEVTSSSSDDNAIVLPSRLESSRRSAPEYQELEYLHLLHSNVHRTLHRDIPSATSRSFSDVRRARITRRIPRRGGHSMCLRSDATTTPFRNRSNSLGTVLQQVCPDDPAASSEVEEASSSIENLTLEADATEVQYYSLDDTEEYNLPNNNEDL